MGRKSIKALQKALDALVDKAEDCADIAKLQRGEADKAQLAVNRLHENSYRLEKLSLALTNDAEEIKEELAAAQAASPSRHQRDDDTTATGATVPK